MILNFWKYAKSQGCRYWQEPFVDILSLTFLSSYACNASMHDIAQVIVPPPTKEKHYRRYLHCLQNDIKIMISFLIFWFSWIRAIRSNVNQQILKHLLFSTSHLFDINFFFIESILQHFDDIHLFYCFMDVMAKACFVFANTSCRNTYKIISIR